MHQSYLEHSISTRHYPQGIIHKVLSTRHYPQGDRCWTSKLSIFRILCQQHSVVLQVRRWKLFVVNLHSNLLLIFLVQTEEEGSAMKRLVWQNGTSICTSDVRVLTSTELLNNITCINTTGQSISYLDVGRLYKYYSLYFASTNEHMPRRAKHHGYTISDHKKELIVREVTCTMIY